MLDPMSADASAKYGPFDLILKVPGESALVFEAMNVLAKNGVLAMVSVTGGMRQLEIPAEKINLGFVLGNKVAFGSVNANREYSFAKTLRGHKSRPGTMLQDHPYAIHFKRILDSTDKGKICDHLASVTLFRILSSNQRGGSIPWSGL